MSSSVTTAEVGHHTQKSHKSLQRDKPKHSGKLHSGPKKGGGGGKFTFGRPGDEAKGSAAIDADDPNYDPDEAADAPNVDYSAYDYEPSSTSSIKFASSLEDQRKFKEAVKAALKEWLQSNDTNEFTRVIKQLDMTVFHQDLPSILIRYSFDQNDANRVRISSLLSALHKGGFVTHTQMGAGVRKLYNSLSDIVVDVPNAKTLLREHVAFASAGGFLDATLAAQLEKEQEALSDEKKTAELKTKIKSIIQEFWVSEDVSDTVRSLNELNAPHLAFETVKQLISQSLDRGNRQREGACVFLADQHGAYLTSEAIEKAFTILLERVDDLVLDVPNVLKLLSIFAARAVVDEVLAPAFLLRVDLNEHDLGSAVLRQAQSLLKQENASDALLYVWEQLEEEAQKKAEASQKSSASATAASK